MIETAILIKHGLWILVTIIFLCYNIFFNKGESSDGYGVDIMPLFRGGVSAVIYLIFWIIWLNIY